MSDLEKVAPPPYYSDAPLDKDYMRKLKAVMVTDLDMANKIFSQKDMIVGFDTETTGLAFYKDEIVGFSLSFNGTSGFYFPLRHTNADYNLPVDETLRGLHKFLLNNTIILFNATFDLSMLGQELPRLGIAFNSIEDYKFVDVQCFVYNLEPEVKKNGLKWAARHFLGRVCPEFHQIVGGSRKKLSQTFADIDPREVKPIEPYFIELKGAKKKLTDLDVLHNSDMLEIGTYEASGTAYAVADSCNTVALYNVLKPEIERLLKIHAKESKETFSAITDNKLTKAMLYYKHVPISLDAELMSNHLDYVEKELEKTESEIFEIAGRVFNISSVQQKREVFNALGINTGVTTKTGMSVSKDVIKDIDHPIIPLLNKRSALEKRKSAYFKPLSESSIGRINYKTTAVSTGRLSSGKGDQTTNSYFSSISIQTLPKSPTCLYEAKYTGEDNQDTILGYSFKEVSPEYCSDNPDGLYIEGFSQELNVRNCLRAPHKVYVNNGTEEIDFGFDINLAENYVRQYNLGSEAIRTERAWDWYVVSADISAEELVVIANLSKEPSFVEPLLAGEDLHKFMARRMFKGFDDMDKANQKNYRRKAKAGNFGLAYRGSYRALLKEIPDEDDALNVYQAWWANMPIYKMWQQEKINQMMTLTDGDAVNLYGRRRRFKGLLSMENQSIVNSAIRAACNHYVQGVGADYIRNVMVKLYETYLKKGNHFDEFRFLASIHDELACCIHKSVIDKWVYRLCQLMEESAPKDFFVPFKACPQIGYTMGHGFDFEFDRDENGKIIEGTLHLKGAKK